MSRELRKAFRAGVDWAWGETRHRATRSTQADVEALRRYPDKPPESKPEKKRENDNMERNFYETIPMQQKTYRKIEKYLEDIGMFSPQERNDIVRELISELRDGAEDRIQEILLDIVNVLQFDYEVYRRRFARNILSVIFYE
jgi:hypothetical protein